MIIPKNEVFELIDELKVISEHLPKDGSVKASEIYTILIVQELTNEIAELRKAISYLNIQQH